ncbi:hypothetical protein BZA05DRAFT_404568 [Tricharina praecox]|uniref:uncharacterized protein n=1 Tax=Tricharina praecox TaxID=43433 RepID=UPI0022205961|nr:uncharacterized protein BZA05DRAFT_404568 [Tricharina praecox]KAI5848149.1 hypothetical protein BZA05DRAFT_404568 [Tricharina praecox]
MIGRRKIFTGTFVHTPSPSVLSILENGAIFVDQSGTIVHIDHDASSPDARLNNDLEEWSGAEMIFTRPRNNEFFFPGFVDTHIHAGQYPNAGLFGKSSLLEWLEEYTFPLEASLADTDVARRVYGRCIARTLANGTTTAAYFATRNVESTNLLADLCLKAGQRAFIGRCCMDQKTPDYYRDADAETAIRDTEACIEHCRQVDPERKLVCPIVTPRFAPCCSPKLLVGLGNLAKRKNLPVQTHISENKAEVEWVKELFASSKSYADVYDSAGLLHERTILAHAIHLTDDEIELIRVRDAKISHCPVSNLALTSGCAKVKALMKKGIKVGLGTDVSGGYSPSILESVRQATLVSRMVALMDGEEAKLSVTEALYLATRGGADVVGLGDKIGTFEVGMQWDAFMVGMGNVPEQEAPAVESELCRKRPRPESDEDEDIGREKMLLPFDGSCSEDEAPNGVDGEGAVKDGESKPLTAGIDFGLDGGPVDIFGFESWEEKVAKWVYNGDDRNTMNVWVAGVEVYRAGGIPPTWALDLTS